MRKVLFLLAILLLITIEYGSLSARSNPKATIEWEQVSYDFGEIPYDKPIKVNFSFKNPGMIPLIISKVETSCGCTVADYPKQPVTSGTSGTISVTFDAKSTGYQSKTITVFSNSQEGLTKLYIKGVVVK